MLTLRLTQYADSQPDCYRVEVALEGDGSRQTAAVQFQFKLTQQEQENIRWYLEDYLQYLSDPAPQIAAKVEKRMAEIGIELFKAIFQANDDARDLWATLRQNLNHTRVEILTDIAQATAIPWELLRDPKTDTCLVWRSPAFVRSYSQPAQRPRLPQTDGDAIRILLVICRPQGGGDVPFRSVASRLIKGLGTRPDGFQLDVLRPPTFEQLGRVLRQAKAQGKPYHVVHFDGHGVYQNSSQLTLNRNPLMFVDHRPGMHGYLAFENGMSEGNVEFVSGSDLGRLLVETDVSVLVLNACRSAHAEPQDAPEQIDETSEQVADLHTQVRSFGSLAQEVMDAGVAGVVAMRYNVYVITAAQFVADLYESLVQGQTLGEAVTFGRKQLRDRPPIEVAFKPVALQDWLVPVVYEAAPIALFPSPVPSNKLTITLNENNALPATGMLDAQLPKTPDAGFFGRDETLLAIDRAFDHHTIVLLHAFAGSGKTSVAAEFGRWYALTGGLLESGNQGHVLFTSFQRYLPLSRVLDKLGQVFERDLERSGIHWLALSDAQRRAVALQLLSQVPVLWIWDNVEPIAGFPDGESQRWSKAEQQELADFLRDTRNTKAKFLLTSRRDERGWLGNLPVRVQVPPMPMQERVQFARVLAEKHGYRLTDVGNWIFLLKYTQGNPLTITVVVGQALRNGYRSKEQIENFVADLRSGEAQLDDDESEGRTKSLEASLDYGFKNTFNDVELKQLALLHLFQGYVSVKVLWAMGHPEVGNLSTLGNLPLNAYLSLFRRAAEIGLLTDIPDSDYYAIHPVLPWFFKKLFKRYYFGEEQRSKVTHAFIKTLDILGNQYTEKYVTGDHKSIGPLSVEEDNMIRANRLALDNTWYSYAIGTMQGLRVLYHHTGRLIEWSNFLHGVLPYFIDLETDRPLRGREEYWSLINDCRVKLACTLRNYSEAEKLQQADLEWNRQNAPAILELPVESLDNFQRLTIRSLMVSLQQLGTIKRERGDAECIHYHHEAIKLARYISDSSVELSELLNLSHSYREIPAIRNLARAERICKRSLELHNVRDDMGRAKCLDQLGYITWERFREAQATGRSQEDQVDLLNTAANYFVQVLKLTPPDAVELISAAYNKLGIIYSEAGQVDQALKYWQLSTRYEEAMGNIYAAAGNCFNCAQALKNAGQFSEALEYARVALRHYMNLGDNALGGAEASQKLVAELEQRQEINGAQLNE